MVVVLSGDVVVILQNLRIPHSFSPCFPTLLQACGPYLESSSLNVSSISSHANIEQCVRSNRQKKADVDRPVGQRAAYDSYSKNVDTNRTRNFEKHVDIHLNYSRTKKICEYLSIQTIAHV
jgi:hypothetical protein